MNARDVFLSGEYNCAESVLAGVIGEIDACNSLAAGFGGGIGGSGDVCGALTGAVMGMGARAQLRSYDTRRGGDFKRMVGELLALFEGEHGARDCNRLIPVEDMFCEADERKTYFSSPERKMKCAEFVTTAERLALSVLRRHGWLEEVEDIP
ncbi:MAG: C-GCAxxG-C-C family protein [Bacillota bacterium]